MPKIYFYGYDDNLGLTFHLVDWMISIYKNSLLSNIVIFILPKTCKQQDLYKKLNEIIPETSMHFDLAPPNEFLADLIIVHCHGIRQAMRLYPIKFQFGRSVKIVLTMHAFKNGCWYSGLAKQLIAIMLVPIDSVIFLSNFSKKYFLRFNILWIIYKSCRVIPLGLSNYKNHKNTEEISGDLSDLNDSRFFHIVYFAQLTKNKGHSWILRAIKLVKFEKCIFWFFGSGSQYQALINEIRELNLQKRVRLPGAVSRDIVPMIYKKAFIAMVGSKNETFGHLYLEPLSYGVPIIGTAVGIGEDILVDGVSGYRIVHGDFMALSNQIENCLRCNEIVMKFKKNLNQNPISMDWQEVVRQYDYIYNIWI